VNIKLDTTCTINQYDPPTFVDWVGSIGGFCSSIFSLAFICSYFLKKERNKRVEIIKKNMLYDMKYELKEEF
jgi:hypothetical protein